MPVNEKRKREKEEKEEKGWGAVIWNQLIVLLRDRCPNGISIMYGVLRSTEEYGGV